MSPINKNSRKADRVLGVAATSRAVHAVLLQNGPDGPEVIRQFSRQRSVLQGGFDEPAPQRASQDTSFGGSEDFTIEFGDSGGSANAGLFLTSEFGGVDTDLGDDAALAATFELELSDILSEVHDAGFGEPPLAFTLSAGDVVFIEIRLPSKKQKRHDRASLIDALTEQYKGIFDEERVSFLPMTSTSETERRYLAVFTKTVDAASGTLMALRDGNERIPTVSLIDAEIPVLVGISRVATNTFNVQAAEAAANPTDEAAEDEEAEESKPVPGAGVNTLVIRAGADETLVLFMRGDTVHHCESLRSLTAFDAPETICSRVLLQQDEHAVGDVHHVLVLSEERESELTDTFGMFFPDATVESLRLYLPSSGSESEDVATAVVSATGAALRAIDDPYYAPAFEQVNFLPKKLLKKKLRLPITWNAVAMSVLIVVTTIFFMARYTSAETEITSYKQRLEEVAPGTLDQDIGVLQARIDSMQQLYTTYTRALEVLDTLLIGSDRWSRMLEKSSKEASAVRGLWIDTFTPTTDVVTITGTATSRDHVVAYAKRVNGSIESLAFSEIREFPVYSYTMKISVQDSLPEAARYLREQVKLSDPNPAVTPVSAVSGGQAGYPTSTHVSSKEVAR